MKIKKILAAVLLTAAAAMPMSSANAFWGGGWMPWDVFDGGYYHPYGYGYPGWGYPGYGGYYPYYGGYYPYYGGYGYPGWGYPGGYGWW